MQVPIQVNKYLAYSDGMRVIESDKLSMQSPSSDGLLFTELDRLVLKLIWRWFLQFLLRELDMLTLGGDFCFLI